MKDDRTDGKDTPVTGHDGKVSLVTGYRMPETRRTLEEPRIKDISYGARKRYANIMSDAAFKLVFGTEANEDLLVALLNCLIPGKNITGVRLLDREVPGFFVGDKKSVFDLYCETRDKKASFVVEMQLSNKKYFKDRMLFYSSYPIREQVITPIQERELRQRDLQVNYRLKPVYMIGILNFELKHKAGETLREGLVSSYSIRSDHGGELMIDTLHFIFFELPRLKIGPDEPEKCKTLLEKLAFAFRHISFLKDRPAWFSEEFFRRLFQEAEIANMTPQTRRRRDLSYLEQLDRQAELDYAHDSGLEEGLEQGISQGLEQGLQQGLKQGIQQGLEQGLEQGLSQGRLQTQKETALKMLSNGLPSDLIAKVTGLSLENIADLP